MSSAVQKGFKISMEEFVARLDERNKLTPEEQAKLDQETLAEVNVPFPTISLQVRLHKRFECGANPNLQDKTRDSLLIVVARRGDKDAVRELLESWADAGFWNGKRCAFIEALIHARTGAAEAIREYLPTPLKQPMLEALKEACEAVRPRHRAYMKNWLDREMAFKESQPG